MLCFGQRMVAKFIQLFMGPSEGLRAKLLRGVIGGIGIKAVYLPIQFAVGVLLARMLGPEGLGVYAFVIALVHLLVVVAQFGFPAFLVRSVAVSRAKNAFAEIKRMLVGAGQIVLLLSLTLLGIGLIWLMGYGFKGIPHSALMAGFFLIPLLALTATTCGAIRGLGHVIVGQLSEEIIRPVTFLLVLLAFWSSGIVLSPERALLAYGFAAFLGLALAVTLLFYRLPKLEGNTLVDTQRSQLLRQSLPFLLLAGAQVMNYQTDVLMLGLLATQEQIGLYRVSLQVAEGLGVVLYAASLAIAPQLARLHAQGDWLNIQRILVYSHRGGALAVLPLALVLILFSGPLIAFVFGEVFRPAQGALNILALGKIAYATVGFSGLALSMLGRPGAATIIMLVTVGMNVVLNFVLIPRYGIEGAALATAVSQFVVNAGGILYLWHQLDYDFSALGRRKKTIEEI